MNGSVAIADPDRRWSEHLAKELVGLGLTVADEAEASVVVAFVPAGRDPAAALQAGKPTLITTNHEDVEHRLLALSHGASDYVVKPCSMREIALRARALLRRAARRAPAVQVVGPLRIEPSTSRVWLDGEALHLTPLELGVLRLLVASGGRLVTRETFLQTVWPDPCSVTLDAVDGRIRSLRKKLGRRASLVENVRGVGYRLAVPEEPTHLATA